MSSRAFDIMRELPAIFATATGIDAADVEIGWRDPETIEPDQLPRVLVYNPSATDPEVAEFGLRNVEFGFAVVVVNALDTDEATLELCELMAGAVNVASFTNADSAVMGSGSVVIVAERKRAIVGALMTAQWEGV